MKITVGIPAYNEEKNIAGIITKLKKYTNDIIVCDDGSNDLTREIAEGLGATVISHETNKGYGAAIKSLFLKAKELKTEVLVTFDADGQHRIEDIPIVSQPIMNNEAELIIGSRFLDTESEDMPNYRKVGIKIITKVTNLSIKKDLTDSQSGFRAYSMRALQNITPSDDGMGVSTEILIKANNTGLKIGEVPIKVSYSGNTSTHDPVSHGTSVILSTIKFTSIHNPLKFYGIPGIIFLIIGLGFIGWTVQIYSQSQEIITNVSLIGIGCIVLGTVLLMTGVILFSIVTVVNSKK
ncbi:glycosyltransferase family 2 protein [Candidatus Nitrosopelagicus sp.]|nr:glycosyltransferase family 2 protein [Candidatus Nitrosopelagicus sp.]|tara:strand:+ start:438 stop:1319 length:882 start_codon:yes stop_codon:yes gene_type:complete